MRRNYNPPQSTIQPRSVPLPVDDDAPIVPPPSTIAVDFERKPVLFTADEKPLVRRIGFS